MPDKDLPEAYIRLMKVYVLSDLDPAVIRGKRLEQMENRAVMAMGYNCIVRITREDQIKMVYWFYDIKTI